MSMRYQRPGVVAKKVGMSALFLPEGERIPITVLEIDCQVICHKKDESKGVYALQVGAGKAKRVTKPLKGHFAKAGIEPQQKLKEFRVSAEAMLPVGTTLGPEYFSIGSFVDVTGMTIGKGMAGAMKRHNFGGLRASHGVSISHRSHGSTGHRKDPGRVFKGKKMAGHLGCEQVTIQNLEVMGYDVEDNLLLLRGAVPGFAEGWVTLVDAIKKPITETHKVNRGTAPKASDNASSTEEGSSVQ